jgi:hypothetical protein
MPVRQSAPHEEQQMTNEMQATPKKPTWKQALLMLVGGAVLGCGGCALFMANIFGVLAIIGGGAFLAGVVMSLAGFIGLLIRVVRSIAGK